VIFIGLDDGTTYGCGRNDFGQLGFGSSDDVLIPTQIQPLNFIIPISIACGQFHTVIATSISLQCNNFRRQK
jgi:alpha-tubulin suppressor-like RCC1 family protein